jgi:hypothetical protein
MKINKARIGLILLLLGTTTRIEANSVTVGIGDVILGFRATDGTGQSECLEVNLGSVSRFHNISAGEVVTLTELSPADLAACYGSDWNTRDEVLWGVVGTSGRVAQGPDGEPKRTLWVSNPRATGADQTIPWERESISGMGIGSSLIETMITTGADGSIVNAEATANSAYSAIINADLAGSWTFEITKTEGVSFGLFNPTIENSTNIAGNSYVAEDFYEIQPGSGDSTFLGTFKLYSTGELTFTGFSIWGSTGVNDDTWYGDVYAAESINDGWIYSADNAAWQYVSGTRNTSVWLYDNKMAVWIWTSKSVYPYYYVASLANWVGYCGLVDNGDGTSTRWYYVWLVDGSNGWSTETDMLAGKLTKVNTSE